MGAKAGKIEDILQAAATDAATPLREVVEMSLAELGDDGADVDVRVPETVATYANPFVLQSVLTELVGNAVEHTDGSGVAVGTTDDGTGITVADRGPGIPENELRVFETGEETQLQHGSGLGLWLVKWGVGRLGGDVQLDVDDTGTRVTVRLPSQLVTPSGDAGPDATPAAAD
ncbi:hypothetical protein BRC83_09725 [Halobacteriales archaeon QS_1_68_17]|nr:MAG: hypothetical protein BRC83_09725 [Halobacteriales archaeon QS_1_68_17]